MSQLPGFTLVERIHECASTTVFRARDRHDRPVVVKLTTDADPSPEELGRLRREFQLGRRFDSPHIIAYLDLVPAGRAQALITEDFGAGPLSAAIPPTGMELSRFLHLAVQLAEGLGHIHAAEVVHKDINPHNIVIDALGKVKYIDFGISSNLREEYQQATTPDKLEGSLRYISPEQTGRMNRPVDFRTDFYSLGITFYEMLTGKAPFSSDDPLELVHCHIARELPELTTARPDLPLVVGLIIAKLTAKEAGARYQSGHGLQVDLERCLRQWELGVKPGPFPLGREDFSETLHLSARLYGREAELAVLSSAFDRVAQGHKEMMLISGYAGIGKSALVQEIFKQVSGRKGFFASGKYDQAAGKPAYAGIAAALGALVDTLLGEPPDALERRRVHLREALGENAALMTDLIPEVALLLGEQVPAPQVSPTEARVRFQMVFRDFLDVFADEEHPLVLFLDDLQWADPASLNLIAFLLSDRKLTHLLLLGAFRSNEIAKGDLLYLMLDNLQEQGLRVPVIHLEPLSPEHLAHLLADSLQADPEAVAPLAHVVARKTNGNPFFTFAWLKELYRRKLLRFSKETSGWSWDLAQIDAAEVGDNVVTFMVDRLGELPQGTRQALRVAACIGNVFDLHTLALLKERDASSVAEDLWPALRRGIIIPLHNNYRLIEQARSTAVPGPGLDVRYRFQHDRVQQAAYALLPVEDRPRTHLRIARAMTANLDDRKRVEKAADIVRHFQAAGALLESERDCIELAPLALTAARKAISSVAYQQALDYLTTALAVMPEDAFARCYDTASAIYRTAVDAAYLSGKSKKAEAWCAVLMREARTDLERARVLDLQMIHYTTMRHTDKAIAVGLEALSLLDVRLNTRPSRATLLWLYTQVRLQQGRRTPAQLADAPPIADDRLITVLDLLMRLALPVYYSGNAAFYAEVILTRVLLAIQHGTSPETANAFVTYGLLLGGYAGRYAQGHAFGQLALQLDKRYGVVELRTRVLFVYGVTIHPWNHHWKTISTYLKQSIEAACRSGDLLFLSMACSQVHHYDPTMDLETSLRESEKFLSFLERVYYKGLTMQARIFVQYRRALMGRTCGRLSLDDDAFDEAGCVTRLKASGNNAWLALYHVLKLELSYTFEAYDEAVTHIEAVAGYRAGIMGQAAEADFCFYAYLTRAARYRTATPADRRIARRAMKKELRRMARWAAHCPINFAHRLLLMRAEWARLFDNPWRAGELYRDAVEAAGASEYRRHVALADELAGRFYLEKGRPHVASAFFAEAEQCYLHWGAAAKVDALHDRYTGETTHTQTTRDTHTITTTRSTAGEGSLSVSQSRTLDLNTVIKSSLAISGEIDYDRLLTKMMHITIESAGAQTGTLISHEGGSMMVETAVVLGEESDPAKRGLLLERADFLSQKVVRYVFRTGKTVVLGHAARDPMFAKDAYLTARGTKSVLCTPIRSKDQITGVLYLENNLVEDTFSEDRVALLQMLTAQAAISLENARLFAASKRNERAVRRLNKDLEGLNEALEQRVVERTAELERVQAELVTRAHHAGMAEIATSVLHNVGNILNSVITSCQLIHATVSQSKMQGLLKANDMLRENLDDLRGFLENDPKGMNLLRYYLQFDKHLPREREAVIDNVRRLMDKVESIREVIMAQQSYAGAGFQEEALDPREIIDDALNILAPSIARHGVRLERRYGEAPHLLLPRNKLIHLVVNLVKNAVEAMADTPPEARVLTVTIGVTADQLELRFADTGQGIAAEDQTRIFQHGFTTKREGHGFGLHSCANTMSDLGGAIKAESDGPGLGAAFVLHLPLARATAPVPN